jgi:hypothetical protein
MPKKITVPLDQRVCKRGHVGKYVARANTSDYCTECELEKRRAIQEAVRALTPPKHEIPLNERVCKYGHVGYYVDYSGNLSCSACRSDQHRRRMELRGA